jgi:hypothetical protein
MAQPKPSLGDLLGQTPKPSAEALRHHWSTPRALAIQACSGLKGGLLTRLTALEKALAERPLLQRAREA